MFKAPVVRTAFSVAASTFSFQQQLELNSKVAVILAHLRLDADTVAATLLYGVLEATPTTVQQLAKLLPSNVSELVGAASRIDRTCVLLRTDHTVKVGTLRTLFQAIGFAVAPQHAASHKCTCWLSPYCYTPMRASEHLVFQRGDVRLNWACVQQLESEML